jgi:Tfp pilus assembly protein PilN
MLKKFYQIQEACGINITLEPNGGVRVDLACIQIQKSELTFTKKISGAKSLSELDTVFPKGIAAGINITGKGVIHKQVELAAQTGRPPFGVLFPDAKEADFYVQYFWSGKQYFISVIRRSDADKWIDKVAKIGLSPMLLGLGAFPLQIIAGQLNIYDASLIFDGYTVVRDKAGDWLSVAYDNEIQAPFPIKVGNENLDEKLLLPYAAAFQLVLPPGSERIAAQTPVLAQAFEKLNAGIQLKVQAAAVLAIYFLLLLVNVIVYTYLNGANERLSRLISRSSQSIDDQQKVSSAIRQKEATLKELGWEEGINKISLVDQLASLLPEGVTLTEASVDPMDITESRIQKSVAFTARKIRITGESEKIILVNEWMARIKTRRWVKNIALDNYFFSNERNTGQFTLIINY